MLVIRVLIGTPTRSYCDRLARLEPSSAHFGPTLDKSIGVLNDGTMNATDYDRYMRHVVKLPSGCYQWTGPRRANGYGRFFEHEKKRYVLAHRWLAEAQLGPDLGTVKHTCGNNLCVNMRHLAVSDIQQFSLHTTQDPSGCILWTGAKGEKGYGSFRSTKAHRWLFVRVHGYEPPVVRHKCDNPSCVNIDHLEGGTHADNARDYWTRGRFRKLPL